MHSTLSLLVKGNGFTGRLLSSTYLIHEICGQLRRKKTKIMYVGEKKRNKTVGCKKLRRFSELYIGSRYR